MELDGRLARLEGKATIGVDFDGVLFDQVPHIIDGFQELHDVDISPVESWEWDLSRHPAIRSAGLSEDAVWEVFHELEVRKEIHRAEPLDAHALAVLEGWLSQGHQVEIVTSRPERARSSVELFLKHNDVAFDDLHMGIHEKTEWDLLIDDLPINVGKAADAGATALLMDHPYNRGFEVHKNPYRVQDWRHIEHVVEQVLDGSPAG